MFPFAISSRVSIASLLAALLMLSVRSADASDRIPPSTMPLRAVDRPLTLLEDHFGLAPEVFVTRHGDEALVGVFAGAGYGVTDDLEVGLTLIRLTLSSDPDTGLDAPTGYVEYRLLDSIFELSARAELELPINSGIDFAVAVPMRLHVASLFRLDLEPRFYGTIASPYTIRTTVPAELRVQLGDRFSVGALASITWPSLRVSRSSLGQVGARLAFTIEKAAAALAEIRATAFSNSVVFGSEAALTPQYGADWTFYLDATIYLRSDPADAAPESPF
jgi:hypothetical protein